MAWSWCKRDTWVQIKNINPKSCTKPEEREQMMISNQTKIIEQQEFWIGKVVERHGRGKKHPLRFCVRLYLPVNERSRWYIPASLDSQIFMAARVKPIAMGKYSKKLRAFWRLEDFSAQICNVPQLLDLMENECSSSTSTNASCAQKADDKSIKEASSTDVVLPSTPRVQTDHESNADSNSGEAHDSVPAVEDATSPLSAWNPEMLDWVQIRNAGYDPESIDKWNSQQFWVGRILQLVGDHNRRKSGLRKFLVDFYEPFPACPVWFVHSPCSSEAYFENYLSSIEMSDAVDDCDANMLANRPPKSYRRVGEWNLRVPVDPPKKKKKLKKKTKPKIVQKKDKRPQPKPPALLSEKRLYDMMAKRRPSPPGFSQVNIVTSSLLHVFGGHSRRWSSRLFKPPPCLSAARDAKTETVLSGKDKCKNKKRISSDPHPVAQPDSKRVRHQRGALRMHRQWRQYLNDRVSNQLTTQTYLQYLF